MERMEWRRRGQVSREEVINLTGYDDGTLFPSVT